MIRPASGLLDCPQIAPMTADGSARHSVRAADSF